MFHRNTRLEQYILFYYLFIFKNIIFYDPHKYQIGTAYLILLLFIYFFLRFSTVFLIDLFILFDLKYYLLCSTEVMIRIAWG